MKLIQELMETCTILSKEVVDLKKTIYSKNDEIKGLKQRFRYLKGIQRSRPNKLKRLHNIGSLLGLNLLLIILVWWRMPPNRG